ncbi:MAG: PP2C family protein-serine/threonine phosphatase [Calditrichota bacterium]
MNKLRFLLTYGLLIAVSSAVIYQIYPKIYPDASVRLDYRKHEIEQRAYDFAESLDLDVEGFRPDAVLNYNMPMLRYTQKSLGLENASKALSTEIPAYRWAIRWKIDQGIVDLFKTTNNLDQRARQIRGMVLEFRTNGELLNFKQELPDSVSVRGLSKSASGNRASELLKDFIGASNQLYVDNMSADSTSMQRAINKDDSNESSSYSSSNADNASLDSTTTDRSVVKGRSNGSFSYKFSMSSPGPAPFDSINTTVVMAGDQLTEFKRSYNVPKQFETAGGLRPSNISFPLLLALIILITVIIALRRWRDYEMDFQFGILLGIVGGFGFCLFIFLQSYQFAPFIQALVSGVINWIFVGGSLIFVWGVGESLGREVWSNKFIPLDLLRNRYFSHSRIGRNIIRGVAFGCMTMALWLSLVLFVEGLEPIALRSGLSPAVMPLSSSTPLMRLLAISVFFVLWSVASYIVFGGSLIQKYLKVGWASMLLVALIYSLALSEEVEPFGINFLVSFPTILLLVWTFYRYNILTTFIAVFVVNLLTPGIAFFYTGATDISGYALLGLLGAAVTYGSATLFTKDRVSDFKRLAPVYTKNISERERMQKELEIARNVQMSFLPHSNPTLKSLDVASRCEPALEVGGDYFDFVELGDHRLGICIGDVSGKGTQAAFYMTLTKGFLRALASGSDSPAEVLTKLNALFYDNVKRGVFISMIYGIFDLAEGTLTLARAGHNPVLMHKGRQIEMQNINPRGIAIGMEKGITFGKTIQEVTIPLQKDDLFVFYTDGFPEAMNKDREEFGEERFEQAIDSLAGGKAHDILEGVFREVRRFTKATPQHDDMTIVVVRVNELVSTALPVVDS